MLSLAKEIVIMGGAFLHYGNITSEAEFNIAYDPEAAQLVFACCFNLVVIPLDVTHQLLFLQNWRSKSARLGPTAQLPNSLSHSVSSWLGRR